MVNFGIWNAAIITAPILKAKYGIISQLWYPSTDSIPDRLEQMAELVAINTPTNIPPLPADAIIVTHGCWRLPTRLGAMLKKKGYPWMYVPHGMLEPWSMSQKWYIKYPYYRLYEKPLSLQADIVRAVSIPEKNNLQAIYPNVVHIPNGNFPPEKTTSKNWNTRPLTFLFMGRLHKKKGLIPLIQAWKQSILNNNPEFQLLIAGPDDGLLSWLKNQLVGTDNVKYLGAIFGAEKENLLQQSHFFVLPSYSEGFPTSVVEAMQYGLIPLISDGCNFPEAFDNKLAFRVTPHPQQIQKTLEQIANHPSHWIPLSEKCRKFAIDQYSVEQIAELQYQCYLQLIHRNPVSPTVVK